MIADSDRWFRNSSREIDAHRDGPTLDAAGLSTFTLIYAQLFPVSAETSHAAWLEQTRDTQLADRAARRADRRARPLRPARRDRRRPRLAAAASRRHRARHGAAAAQPADRDDRPRTPVGAGTIWAKRVAGLTGQDWQAHFAFRAGSLVDHGGPEPAPPARRTRGRSQPFLRLASAAP